MNSAALNVVGTAVSSSAKRLKLNEMPLINALHVIKQLEPVEHDKAHDLTEPSRAYTPRCHQ